MAPSTELLVHVSAPSRVSDDARYRNEALGYIEFEAENRHALHLPNAKGVEDSESFASALQVGDSFSDVVWTPQTPAPIAGTPTRSLVQEERANLRMTTLHGATASIEWSWSSPEASRGSFLPVPATMVRTPAALNHSIHVTRTPANVRPRTAPTDPSCIQDTPYLHRAQSDSWETPPSVIPDSQPFLQPLKRPHNSSSPSPTNRSASPSPKRLRKAFESDAPGEPPLQVTATQPESLAFVFSTSTSAPVSLPSGAPTTFLTIYAPPPSPDTLPFKTHLTDSLSIISKHLPTPAFFTRLQLQPPLRPLRASERGHWAVPISSLPNDTWGKFWLYLEKFIGDGRAGVAVWCVVEGTVKEGAKSRSESRLADGSGGYVNEGKPQGPQDGLAKDEIPGMDLSSMVDPVLKTYCWGETAPEIWLLLFMASHRQIKGCGAKWIDAEGHAVLQMK